MRTYLARTYLAMAAALLLSSAAHAQSLETANVQPVIGVGMICNTPNQARQFLELQSKGTQPQKAVHAVNAHAKDAHACGLAAVAFVPSKTVETKPLHNKLVRVVRIQVLAGYDGGTWRPVTMTQYAVIEDDSGLTI